MNRRNFAKHLIGAGLAMLIPIRFRARPKMPQIGDPYPSNHRWACKPIRFKQIGPSAFQVFYEFEVTP